MVRRCNKDGFEFTHIHDAMGASPQYMNKVRKHYQDILCEIADSNILADILSQISGTEVIIDKTIDNLSDYIKEAEYFLS